jgi:hypothetical protein
MEMEAGSPGADYRSSPQTARRCLGISSQVVNGPGKGEMTRQVRTRRANESEPRMFCRRQPSPKPDRFGSLGQVQQEPVYGLDGDRQFSGASLAQAFMWDMGTWHSDTKGETQKGGPVRVRVPMRSAGTDRLVVVLKPGNAGGAKGPNRPASGMDQPARGGMRV